MSLAPGTTLSGTAAGKPTSNDSSYWNGYGGVPGMDASINTATNQAGANSAQDRSQLESLLNGGGQSALDTYAQGAMSSAMPGLNAELQKQAESNIRSGTSTGDLGTSFEGDLYSAFQRNMSNAIAGQSMNLYNTNVGANEGLYNTDTSNYMDAMYANRDFAQGQENARKKRNAGLWGGVLGAVGAIGGGAAGGGQGAQTGAQIGATVGQGLGG